MSKTYSFTKDQLNFVAFMKRETASSKELSERYVSIVDKIYGMPTQSTVNGIDIAEIREQHNPAITADFLSLFGSPDGLKFLTHDFDSDSEYDVEKVIKQVTDILDSSKYKFQLPKSLYGLFKGFIYGPLWKDSDGDDHKIYLKSEEFQAWIKRNPLMHPITSNEFGSEIQKFRNTVRLSKPRLPQIIFEVMNNNTSLKNLNVIGLDSGKLDRADFYTNIYILKNRILSKVLSDMAQRDISHPISIVYERSYWEEYRLHEIRITHIGSEANPFEDAKRKLLTKGGALFDLLNICKGYCDWTIEANFEGDKKRWRILNYRHLPEEEFIADEDVKGFTHIFTFYKYR